MPTFIHFKLDRYILQLKYGAWSKINPSTVQLDRTGPVQYTERTGPVQNTRIGLGWYSTLIGFVGHSTGIGPGK